MLLKISCLLILLVLFLSQSLSIKRRCLHELDQGKGKAYLRHWFYNSTSQRCQRFIFYGGARNGNNFNTQAQCRKICLTQQVAPINLAASDDGF
ncbi:kappaPI-actitoxin-Avd3b [Drosophila eugracilis]|uniref:kappaPI-actitoxin-Avd3b n=1 Tax=Drosophila eugracilis TaxID=29029 RepID=UPI001BDB67FE|nr:kappaPI-actitoxin-Avd3b [Drosophila eugracilis]